jgi:hypothetical protein
VLKKEGGTALPEKTFTEQNTGLQLSSNARIYSPSEYAWEYFDLNFSIRMEWVISNPPEIYAVVVLISLSGDATTPVPDDLDTNRYISVCCNPF